MHGIITLPFFSYPMPIFSALPTSLMLLLQDVKSLTQPIRILTAHPCQGKPKKIKSKLRMCIFQQRSVGGGMDSAFQGQISAWNSGRY